MHRHQAAYHAREQRIVCLSSHGGSTSLNFFLFHHSIPWISKILKKATSGTTMLISFGLLHLNNSFYKSPGRNTGCCAASFPRNLYKHLTVHILKNHCHGNFFAINYFSNVFCISLEDIYDPMIHQIYISSWHTGSKHLFQVQKKLNLMEISPTQQKPNFFRLFEVISLLADLYTRTLTGARNFNMLEPPATILPLSLYFYSSELSI